MQYKIKEYDEALELIAELKRQVEAGEIMSVLCVTERTDVLMGGSCTSTQNVFAVGGYMMCWALKRMGFVQDDELRVSKPE